MRIVSSPHAAPWLKAKSTAFPSLVWCEPTIVRMSSVFLARPDILSPRQPRPWHAWHDGEPRAEKPAGCGSGGGEPDVGDHAWPQIHLGSELRHIEAVQDIDRAQQYL